MTTRKLVEAAARSNASIVADKVNTAKQYTRSLAQMFPDLTGYTELMDEWLDEHAKAAAAAEKIKPVTPVAAAQRLTPGKLLAALNKVTPGWRLSLLDAPEIEEIHDEIKADFSFDPTSCTPFQFMRDADDRSSPYLVTGAILADNRILILVEASDRVSNGGNIFSTIAAWIKNFEWHWDYRGGF